MDHRELKTGSKYLTHADGKEDEPLCASMCISPNGDVAVSDLNSTYIHILSGIRDSLADSAGNPVVFGYIQDAAASPNSSQTHSQDTNTDMISLSSGYYLGGDTPMIRCRDVVKNSVAGSSGEVNSPYSIGVYGYFHTKAEFGSKNCARWLLAMQKKTYIRAQPDGMRNEQSMYTTY